MNKKKKKEVLKYTYGLRNSWNGINPVTKVIPDKTKYTRKHKHKNSYETYE